MNLQIRSATKKDIPNILAMIREFAAFEKLSQYCEITEDRLQTALFGETPVAEAIIALENETPVAYAVFYPNFLTFRGQCGFFLEDIYIKPASQGKKLGEKMLRYIARLAKSRGFERIDFWVLNWNEAAIGFYKKLGAVVDESEKHFKFTDEAFQKLVT